MRSLAWLVAWGGCLCAAGSSPAPTAAPTSPFTPSNTTVYYDDDRWYRAHRRRPVYWGVNAAICAAGLLGAGAFVRAAGCDGPIRDDGIASPCDAASCRALGGRQGRAALAYLVAGTALFVVFGQSKRKIQVGLAGAGLHLVAFLLFAFYPGCCGQSRGCRTGVAVPRALFGVCGWACCACAGCLCVPNLLTTASFFAWQCYFCPCARPRPRGGPFFPFERFRRAAQASARSRT